MSEGVSAAAKEQAVRRLLAEGLDEQDEALVQDVFADEVQLLERETAMPNDVVSQSGHVSPSSVSVSASGSSRTARLRRLRDLGEGIAVDATEPATEPPPVKRRRPGS